ncbi:alpha/beta hydrolase [Arthrobacter sp. ISL-30]|uniref:alpha/beta hydrolase n=1 Tax=Arthrobacter sp. ISL-30 TaxID=2819109 RepID=UPI001BE83482|nr:alpha/beta hydrolase [Arthrobacter sp. ISL-30]MBT2512844.1 alpha/beta hydrolase [Arthrobacter sp. ISL-30]
MTSTRPVIDTWPHLFRPGDEDAPVLLMLHGTASNERDIASLAGRLQPAAGVLAPRGRVEESGMLRWFRRHAEGVFDVDDVILRAGELAAFIDDARSSYGIGDRKIVAVGFSNGANIALATAMLHPQSLNRVVAFSGMYPLGERTSAVELEGSRFLVLNGDADPMAPIASVTKLLGELKRQGAAVDQLLRPGGHGIQPPDLEAARNWLAGLA